MTKPQPRRLSENWDISCYGVVPAGPFDIPGGLARQMLSASGNPNGRPNSDVVRPYCIGKDLTLRNRDVWIIDFGTMSQDEAMQYQKPFEHIKTFVYPIRF